MLNVQSLLVDLDGTLLGNRGLNVSLDFVTRAVRRLKPLLGTRGAFTTLFQIFREFQRPHGELTNDVRVITILAEKLNITMEEARHILRDGVLQIFPKLAPHFYPIQGAREFLDWAKDKYPLVLATNPVWPEEIAQLRLEWAGIDPKTFRSITHVRRMKACKPAAEYYQEVLQQEGFSAESTLLIGDDVSMDLPATRVGVSVFIVGKYKRVTELHLDGMKAPAWRGSYQALREMLQSSQSAP